MSLEAIGNSDWGTFDIVDEIGLDTKESSILSIQQQLLMEMVDICIKLLCVLLIPVLKVLGW